MVGEGGGGGGGEVSGCSPSIYCLETPKFVVTTDYN